MRDADNNASTRPPTIVLAVNDSWNIVNFRRGLIEGLQRQGYDVVALSPAEGSKPLADMGVRHIPINLNSKSISPREDAKYVWHCYRALKELRAVAYLGFTPKPNGLGSLAAHALGIPVINNMTGMAFVERTGLSRRLPMAMLKIAFRRSRTVFFQNPDDRELFIKEDIVKSGIARLLPGSGIDLKRFKPTHPTENVGKGLKLLLIGRLLREKGIIEYIEAAEIVRHQRTDIEFQLLGFLGTANPSALTAAHVDSWANAGLVNYLGSAEDVRPFIAAADCVVLPSYREGLPRALLEGAAMGKPLIATDVPGCRAVVEQGVNGYLCEVRNSRSLADSILKLAELPTERRRELGSQGRLKVEREFSEAIVVKRYLEAIEKLGSF